MVRTVSLLSLALTLSVASFAAAGGPGCDKAHAAKARQTASVSHDRQALEAKLAKKGWLGLDTEKDAAGAAVVTRVAPGSPAEKAGFQKGDVLVAFNGVAIQDGNKEALKQAKAGLGVGKSVSYTVSRAGSTRQLSATLAPVPAEVLAQWVEKESAQPVAVAQKDN